MLRLKAGVRVGGIQPETVLAISITDSIFQHLGITECTVTSVMEGVHKPGSLHYKGRAFDLRTRHLKPQLASEVRDLLDQALGADYDVVLEKDHIHIEYDPK